MTDNDNGIIGQEIPLDFTVTAEIHEKMAQLYRDLRKSRDRRNQMARQADIDIKEFIERKQLPIEEEQLRFRKIGLQMKGVLAQLYKFHPELKGMPVRFNPETGKFEYAEKRVQKATSSDRLSGAIGGMIQMQAGRPTPGCDCDGCRFLRSQGIPDADGGEDHDSGDEPGYDDGYGG